MYQLVFLELWSQCDVHVRRKVFGYSSLSKHHSYCLFILQVILSIAFADVNVNTAAIYVFNNAQLQNTSIAGPLENLTTIHVASNARLAALQINMPPNSSLETLILSNNNLTTVSSEWFINTPSLTEISLANNSICEYMHRCLFYN